jgi:hypothetical protein
LSIETESLKLLNKIRFRNPLVTEQIFGSIESEWSGDRTRLVTSFFSLGQYLEGHKGDLSDRDNVRMNNRLGDMLVILGHPERAFEYYDHACREAYEFPEMSMTYKGLASVVRLMDNDYVHARNLISVARSYCGDKGRYQAALHLEEGLIERLEGGSIQKAIKLHNEGIVLAVNKLSNGHDVLTKRLYGQLNSALYEEYLISGGFHEDFEHNSSEAYKVAKELGCKPDLDVATGLMKNLQVLSRTSP